MGRFFKASKLACFLLFAFALPGCNTHPTPLLSRLNANGGAPLYTTYAAAKENSRYLLDEGYHFQYSDSSAPVEYTTDSAGNLGLAITDGDRDVVTLQQWESPPVVTLSYPDLMRWKGKPLPDLEVSGEFAVSSSRLAMQTLTLRNITRFPRTVRLLLYARSESSNLNDIQFESGGVAFTHDEPPDRWTVSHGIPSVTPVYDLLLLNPGFITSPRELVASGGSIQSLSPLLKNENDKGIRNIPHAGTVAFVLDIDMLPMAKRTVRLVRGVAPSESSREDLRGAARLLLASNTDAMLRANEERFRRVPELKSKSKQQQMLYWSCWAMMSQVMLPPENDAPVNYYVFSREPTWGWGHGGQVFHESLTMMAYALMDPAGAMDSQRLFALRQDTSGYIPYRIGPYLNETIETNGQRTTSAPWYAWTNWEVYTITHDRSFLEQMYASSKRLYRWYTSHRDVDDDGLCEWGGHAVLESVRDARVAVWDQVADPTEVEALDLNCMLVMEAKALANMARELGLDNEAARYRMDAEIRSEKIRDTMWDEKTGFFYHVSRDNHTFTISHPNDLKRKEIIGFLPLWAGIASDRQAARIVNEHLLNRKEFWREFGVPSLCANDPYYNPQGYWNGPVWVEWNYLVQRGLFNYGYDKEARELAGRVADGMINVLGRTHTLWEFYSPDEAWGGWHATYIWAGLVNRMLLDCQAPPTSSR